MLETKAHSSSEPVTAQWVQAPLDDVIDHLLEAYHLPLKRDLPRLHEALQSYHAATNTTVSEALLSHFAALHAELSAHLMKEEQILFPMISAGRGAMTGGPISVMHHEHDSAVAALTEFRHLTGGYAPTEGSSDQERSLWAELHAFDTELANHILIENDVLFPRALSGT